MLVPIRKLPPTLRQLPRRMIKQGNSKEKDKDQASSFLNNQVRSKMAIPTPHQEGSQEEPKSL